MKAIMSIVALCGVMASFSASAGVVVVGKNSTISSMDADEVKRVFLGHEPNINGQNLVVLYQTNSPAQKEFESKVLGKTGSDLSTYWSRLIFTGRATAPVEVNGDAGVKAKLNADPNAIGYVSDEGVDSTLKVIFKY